MDGRLVRDDLSTDGSENGRTNFNTWSAKSWYHTGRENTQLELTGTTSPHSVTDRYEHRRPNRISRIINNHVLSSGPVAWFSKCNLTHKTGRAHRDQITDIIRPYLPSSLSALHKTHCS